MSVDFASLIDIDKDIHCVYFAGNRVVLIFLKLDHPLANETRYIEPEVKCNTSGIENTIRRTIGDPLLAAEVIEVGVIYIKFDADWIEVVFFLDLFLDGEVLFGHKLTPEVCHQLWREELHLFWLPNVGCSLLGLAEQILVGVRISNGQVMADFIFIVIFLFVLYH